MTNDTRRGYFHVLDALHKQKEAASQVDVGMSWLRGAQSDEMRTEMRDIQDDMDAMIKRLANVISKTVK